MVVQFRHEDEWDDQEGRYGTVYDAADGLTYHGSFIRVFPSGETVSYHHIDGFQGNAIFDCFGVSFSGFLANVEFVDNDVSQKMMRDLSDISPEIHMVGWKDGRLAFVIKADSYTKEQDIEHTTQIIKAANLCLQTMSTDGRNTYHGNICQNCGGTFRYGEAECQYCHYVSKVREDAMMEDEHDKELLDAAVEMNRPKTGEMLKKIILAIIVAYIGYNALILILYVVLHISGVV